MFDVSFVNCAFSAVVIIVDTNTLELISITLLVSFHQGTDVMLKLLFRIMVPVKSYLFEKRIDLDICHKIVDIRVFGSPLIRITRAVLDVESLQIKSLMDVTRFSIAYFVSPEIILIVIKTLLKMKAWAIRILFFVQRVERHV